MLLYSILSQKSSVIRQKGDLKTGVTRKQSTSNIPKNENFLPPDAHTHMCVSGGKCSFFRIFGALFLLATPVLRFALLLYYRRNKDQIATTKDSLCPLVGYLVNGSIELF